MGTLKSRMQFSSEMQISLRFCIFICPAWRYHRPCILTHSRSQLSCHTHCRLPALSSSSLPPCKPSWFLGPGAPPSTFSTFSWQTSNSHTLKYHVDRERVPIGSELHRNTALVTPGNVSGLNQMKLLNFFFWNFPVRSSAFILNLYAAPMTVQKAEHPEMWRQTQTWASTSRRRRPWELEECCVDESKWEPFYTSSRVGWGHAGDTEQGGLGTGMRGARRLHGWAQAWHYRHVGCEGDSPSKNAIKNQPAGLE